MAINTRFSLSRFFARQAFVGSLFGAVSLTALLTSATNSYGRSVDNLARNKPHDTPKLVSISKDVSTATVILPDVKGYATFDLYTGEVREMNINSISLDDVASVHFESDGKLNIIKVEGIPGIQLSAGRKNYDSEKILKKIRQEAEEGRDKIGEATTLRIQTPQTVLPYSIDFIDTPEVHVPKVIVQNLADNAFTFQNQVGVLSTTNNFLASQVNTDNVTITNQAQQIQELQSRLQQRDLADASLLASNQLYQASIQKNEATLQASQATIKADEFALATQQAKIGQLTATVVSQNETIAANTQTNASLSHDYAVLSAQYDAMTASLSTTSLSLAPNTFGTPIIGTGYNNNFIGSANSTFFSTSNPGTESLASFVPTAASTLAANPSENLTPITASTAKTDLAQPRVFAANSAPRMSAAAPLSNARNGNSGSGITAKEGFFGVLGLLAVVAGGMKLAASKGMMALVGILPTARRKDQPLIRGLLSFPSNATARSAITIVNSPVAASLVSRKARRLLGQGSQATVSATGKAAPKLLGQGKHTPGPHIATVVPRFLGHLIQLRSRATTGTSARKTPLQLPYNGRFSQGETNSPERTIKALFANAKQIVKRSRNATKKLEHNDQLNKSLSDLYTKVAQNFGEDATLSFKAARYIFNRRAELKINDQTIIYLIKENMTLLDRETSLAAAKFLLRNARGAQFIELRNELRAKIKNSPAHATRGPVRPAAGKPFDNNPAEVLAA